MDQNEATISQVKEYYGKVLKSTKDLKSDACCSAERPPEYIQEALELVHQEVKDRFYGCGTPIPMCLEGCTVLDLGSGTGRDCFITSKLVGESGKVIGIDMTEEQLEVAKTHRDYHAKAYGYKESNVDFKHGYIEDLKSAGIADNSIDVVISNCVINLSPQKERVFSEIFRVLKPGGELYFSDVYAGNRIPENLKEDPVLLGECLSGAMYIEDFRRLLHKLGCSDFRTISSSPITAHAPEIKKKLGATKFYSITVRAFKIRELEDRCEDYGQVAYYNGSLQESPNAFDLDDHHHLQTSKPFPVCGNTALMLSKTRFAPHFRIEGNTEKHFGLFSCDSSEIGISVTEKSSGSCC